MGKGAGDGWRVATRQPTHRLHCARERGTSMCRLRHTPALPRLSAFLGHSFVLCTPLPPGEGHGVRVGISRHASTPTLSPTPLPVGEGLLTPSIEALASTHPEDVVPRGCHQQAAADAARRLARGDAPAVASALVHSRRGWRNRAMRHTPLGRRPRPEPVLCFDRRRWARRSTAECLPSPQPLSRGERGLDPDAACGLVRATVRRGGCARGLRRRRSPGPARSRRSRGRGRCRRVR